MRIKALLLLPLLAMLASCSKGKEEIKKLYPQKVVIGSTTHDFYYDQGRVYSVTTNKPNFYEEVTYTYYDEYFKKPDHRFKDEIVQVRTEPDVGPIGWDSNDSIVRKMNYIWTRSEDGLVPKERQSVFLQGRVLDDHITHRFNTEKRLTSSIYHYNNSNLAHTLKYDADPRYIHKKIDYTYNEQGKLQKVSYSAPSSQKPYLTIELEFDDKPGYLQSLPLEARFMPLELPYRNHNITRYTVRDRDGNIRKDVSYTCSYKYNRDGYPTKIKRTMLDGQELEGYIVYKASIGKSEVAEAALGAAQ